MGLGDLNPLSAGIKSLVGNTVGKVVDKLADHYLPASMSEAEKAEFKLRAIELTQKQLETDAKAIESVNATMRAEAKSDKWWQSAWRPTVGFTFSAVIINNYILMPYFTWVHAVDIPQGVWNSILVVLGAAAATRGVERWQRERNKQ